MLIINNYALASELVNMDTIQYIESSRNINAYNKNSQARGLFQITPIVLKEYNQLNKTNYGLQSLFNGNINYKIAKWYLECRIPQLLKYYKKEIKVKNIIWAYNAGIGNVIKNRLPKETKEYLLKYKKFNLGKI